MNNDAPIREPAGSPGWVLWFKQVLLGLSGWERSMRVEATIDFGVISGGGQGTGTISLKGARPGSAVIVTPEVDTIGIIYTGVVTAADAVTIYAKNCTAAAIDPPSTNFRIIVLQG